MREPKPVPSTLIVWEAGDTGIELYLIPNARLTKADKATLLTVAGHFRNSSSVEVGTPVDLELTRLGDLLVEKEEYCDESTPKKDRCRLAEYKQQTEKCLVGRLITRVVVSGWLP